MSDPVTCLVCGFTCKNSLDAYSPMGGGTNFIDIDLDVDLAPFAKTKKHVPICTTCAKIIAKSYLEASDL